MTAMFLSTYFRPGPYQILKNDLNAPCLAWEFRLCKHALVGWMSVRKALKYNFRGKAVVMVFYLNLLYLGNGKFLSVLLTKLHWSASGWCCN